jgi:hypothetical protein
VVIVSIALFVAWRTQWFHSSPSRANPDSALLSASDAGEQVDTNLTSVEPMMVETSPHPPEGSVAEEDDQLIFDPPPDTPAQASAMRQQFGDQLLRASEMNGIGTPEEGCLEWGRLLALALDDEGSDDERSLAFLNVTYACGRREVETPRSPHELRMAHEAFVRRVEDDPLLQEELDRFLAEHPEFKNTRSAFLVVNQHTVGTSVALDGKQTCTEPCTLAVPVDAKPHRITFAGPAGGEASVVWSPSTPDAAPPPLPELAPAN